MLDLADLIDNHGWKVHAWKLGDLVYVELTSPMGWSTIKTSTSYGHACALAVDDAKKRIAWLGSTR